ncbi:unnamed protein product, partial [Urochloa humidicola]
RHSAHPHHLPSSCALLRFIPQHLAGSPLPSPSKVIACRSLPFSCSHLHLRPLPPSPPCGEILTLMRSVSCFPPLLRSVICFAPLALSAVQASLLPGWCPGIALHQSRDRGGAGHRRSPSEPGRGGASRGGSRVGWVRGCVSRSERCAAAALVADDSGSGRPRHPGGAAVDFGAACHGMGVSFSRLPCPCRFQSSLW